MDCPCFGLFVGRFGDGIDKCGCFLTCQPQSPTDGSGVIDIRIVSTVRKPLAHIEGNTELCNFSGKRKNYKHVN